MTDESPETPPAKKSAKPDPQAPVDNRTAKIRVIAKEAKAKGFTLAKGQIVSGVGIVHAEYLVKKGEAEILEVS